MEENRRIWGGRAFSLRRELRGNGRVEWRYADRPAGLNAMFAAAVSQRGAAEALVFEDDGWTWADLEARVARLAGGLRGCGVSAGDRVALLTGNSADFLFIVFAVARLGAISVPISAREQQPGVAHMVADSGAVLFLYQEMLQSAVPSAAQCPAVRRFMCIGSDDYNGLFDAAPVASAPEDEESVAAILYTSGTTGPAKGVPLLHGAIVHSAMTYAGTMQLGPDDRSIAAVPLSHVTGLVALIATIVQAKAKLIILKSFSAREFLDVAERERMTHTVMVPAMYNLCLLSGDFSRRNLSSWRVAGFGGASMAAPTIEKLRLAAPDLRLMNLYGATETASPAVVMPPQHAEDRADAVGEPVPGCEIVVMDEEGREVPPHAVGELWIRGAMVARGYWQRPSGSGDFIDGFWRSGDLGSIDSSGMITLRGRSKETINRGGYKIYPAEIESALMGFPGIVEVAVVGRPCGVLGERVHAVVVTAEAGSVEAAALSDALRGQFSDYKVPETWDIRNEPLPRNANGKVQKRILQEGLEPYRHRAER